jgi:drug/metabolite transporter (DMT)-like permease
MAVSGWVGGLILLPALATQPPPPSVIGLVLLSGLCEALYAFGLSLSYGRGQLSVAYPLARGTAPLVVTAFAVAVLGQRPALVALAGAVALALGLGSLAAAGRGGLGRSVVPSALATGVVIAGYSVVDARAVRSAPAAGYLAAVMLVQAGLLTGALGFDFGRIRRALGGGALVAVGSVGAYLLVLLAFRRAPAGRVATLREIAVLIGILAARERPGRLVWLGASLVVVGAVLAGA